MRHSTFFNNFDYDFEKIHEDLKQLLIKQNDNTINTFYKDRVINTTFVSDAYQVFDFPSFCLNVLPEIDKFFKPEKGSLRINKGIQELRLVGETFFIGKDEFKKQFNIVSSTNKSKALQINVGLFRKVCSNGMFAGVHGKTNGFKVKHFKTSLPEKLDEFLAHLGDFNIIIDGQKEVLHELENKNVSFVEIVNRIGLDEAGNIKKTNMGKLKAFGKKLLTSESDKLEQLFNEQKYLLNKPQLALTDNNVLDVVMPKMTAFNCWTEVYKNYDSPTIKKESTRILEVLHEI